MKTIGAGKFKAQCLALLDEVAQTNEILVITKHGKPIAKLLPYDSEKQDSETPLKGLATFIGDIVSPIGVDWEAAKE